MSRAALPLWLGVLASCGGSSDTATFSCDRDPPLSYANFGEGFLSTHCEGCHSSLIPDNLREGAPPGVSFSSYADVLSWAGRIEARSIDPSAGMPPGGGPSEDDRRLLHEWLVCDVFPSQAALAEE
jgi:uncharacterized membrane protein